MTTAGYQRPTWPPVVGFVFPMCACDACGETAETVADNLENTMFNVVAGHLRQRIERHGLTVERGNGHSWTLLDRHERSRIRRLLRNTLTRWQPWPRRPCTTEATRCGHPDTATMLGRLR